LCDLWDSVKDVGDSIWDAVAPYTGQIVYTAVYIGLTFTPIDPVTANMIAGAAAGAVTGADNGGPEGVIIGAFTGGALGAFSGAFAGMDQVPNLFSAGLSFGTGLMLNQTTDQMNDGDADSDNIEGKLVASDKNYSNKPNYKLYEKGYWHDDTEITARLGQGVKITVRNINALGTSITIKAMSGNRGKPFQVHEAIVLPYESKTFKFSMFSDEPVSWRFKVATKADVFLVLYKIESTWVPGMKPNR
jgi:hypothetical protein